MNDDIVQRAESMLENRLPPGTLELAVNDPAIWAQLEVAAQLCDFVPELVAEIKRLRELGTTALDFYVSSIKFQHRNAQLIADVALEWIDEAERSEEQLAAKDIELARWQQIAINELARSMYNEAMIDREYDLPDGINGFKD